MCLAALLCEQFNFVGAKISIKSYFMRSFFFLSVFSSSEVLAKITFIRSKLPTAACWSWEKTRKLWTRDREANLLYRPLCQKRLRHYRHHRQIIHSVLRMSWR